MLSRGKAFTWDRWRQAPRYVIKITSMIVLNLNTYTTSAKTIIWKEKLVQNFTKKQLVPKNMSTDRDINPSFPLARLFQTRSCYLTFHNVPYPSCSTQPLHPFLYSTQSLTNPHAPETINRQIATKIRNFNMIKNIDDVFCINRSGREADKHERCCLRAF